jgi:hypothetical protein
VRPQKHVSSASPGRRKKLRPGALHRNFSQIVREIVKREMLGTSGVLQEINLFIDIQLGVMSLKNRLLDVNVNEFVYFFAGQVSISLKKRKKVAGR